MIVFSNFCEDGIMKLLRAESILHTQHSKKKTFNKIVNSAKAE